MSTMPRIALFVIAFCAALATSPLHAQSVMKPGGWQMDSSVTAVSPDGATKDLGRHSMRVRLSAEALAKEPYLSPRIDDAKAPFLLVLSVRGARGGGAAGRIVVPWFAVGLVAVAGANSLHLLPGAWQAGLLALDNLLLGTALAALGLGTQWSAIRRAGGRPMVLATVLFGWLVPGGALVNGAIGDWWD